MCTYAPDTCEIKKLGLEPIEFLKVLESKLKGFSKKVDDCEFKRAKDSITIILEQDRLCALKRYVKTGMSVIIVELARETPISVERIEQGSERSRERYNYNDKNSTHGLYNPHPEVNLGLTYFDIQDYLLDVLIPKLYNKFISGDLFTASFPYEEPADNLGKLCWKIDTCTFQLCKILPIDSERKDKLNNDELHWLLGSVFALCFSTVMNIRRTQSDLQDAHDIMKRGGWKTWKTSAYTLASLAALMFVILELLLTMNYQYPVSTIYINRQPHIDALICIILKAFRLF